jgi:hypothetical protein
MLVLTVREHGTIGTDLHSAAEHLHGTSKEGLTRKRLLLSLYPTRGAIDEKHLLSLGFCILYIGFQRAAGRPCAPDVSLSFQGAQLESVSTRNDKKARGGKALSFS